MCHYLPFIGVDPDYQKHGLGRKLMDAVENICRETPVSSGIALDTGNARYIRFYTSLGYRKIGEIELGSVKEILLFKSLVNDE
jgi:ribosomal protein S18 acetylase RimI-like enzyme